MNVFIGHLYEILFILQSALVQAVYVRRFSKSLVRWVVVML